MEAVRTLDRQATSQVLSVAWYASMAGKIFCLPTKLCWDQYTCRSVEQNTAYNRRLEVIKESLQSPGIEKH